MSPLPLKCTDDSMMDREFRASAGVDELSGEAACELRASFANVAVAGVGHGAEIYCRAGEGCKLYV